MRNNFSRIRFFASAIEYWLVVLTILKNISQWEGLSHDIMENKKCLKPPTRKSNIKRIPAAGRS